MKKITFTLKSMLLGCILVVSSTGNFNANAQEGIIWSQVKDMNDLKTFRIGDQLFSANPQIQTLIDNYSINQIEQAVPASKNERLQNLMEITCACDEQALLAELSRIPTIFSEPVVGPKYETLDVPDDYTLVFTDDYALDLINAKEAWDVTHGDASVIIAISDQNYYVNHEELAGKVNYYDSTNTAPQYHGTAVAVTAAGNTNNSMGKSAIGYNSQLSLYRMSYNDLLLATYSGHRIINVSWASGCSENPYVQEIIDEVYNNGSIIVAAAGNGGTCGGAWNLVYPAACNHVISVTGTGSADNHENIPGDSTSTFQHNTDVDIAAPGILIPLTVGPGSYVTSSGTSFSAPLVSGTIALMLAVDPCLTFEDVELILDSTAENIDALNPQYAGLLGSGRLDAGAAVEMAANYMSCFEGNDPVVPIATIENQSTANLNEHGDNEMIELNVFPNPLTAGNSLTIRSNAIMESCVITNVNGELIDVVSPDANEIILNNLTQGVYFVKIATESGVTKTKKLVVI